jgi:hypothetical protein
LKETISAETGATARTAEKAAAKARVESFIFIAILLMNIRHTILMGRRWKNWGATTWPNAGAGK